MSDRDAEAIRTYHAATCHDEARLRAGPQGLDWENQPIPWKLYRGLEALALPHALDPGSVPALRALAPLESSACASATPDLATLARLLLFSAGVTKRKRVPGGERQMRAYPNTGALYHVDLYLVCGALPGLDAGVYHFGPHDFALRRLRAGDWRGACVAASGGEPHLARAPALLVSGATWWRNAWKYRARAYRHAFWDAGTLHANLLALGAVASLAPRLVLGFADRDVEALLALDPEREGALTMVAIGAGDEASLAPRPAPLELETEPLSRHELDQPEIRAAHAATSLPDAEAASRWRAAAAPLRADPPARGKLFPLPSTAADAAPSEPLASVILRRGSTREFDAQASLSLEELARVLDAAAAGAPSDFAEWGASLLDLYLIAHAVEGLPPGAYYLRRGERALELLREGHFRREAGRLALGQPLGADACADLYSLCDLESVLVQLGARGYRAAQLEGGIAGGRAYLASYAQGFGATGLTFLDGEVVDFFSPHAAGKAVMFLVALGRSARRRRD